MAKLVSDYMENHGTKFLRKCHPQKIEKLNDGKLKVHSLKKLFASNLIFLDRLQNSILSPLF
jgi:hypothetical protein